MEECDLVMKGGITSGVVYPHAIAEIATRYRLRNIGGTSAGAIAATFAAAAEYRRQVEDGSMTGFDKIREVAGTLASDMGTLFQPSPKMKPLYDLMIAAIEAGESGNKLFAVLRANFRIFARQWLLGATVALVGIAGGILGESLWLALFTIVFGLLLSVGWVAYALYRLLAFDVPAENYGLCPGLTQSGSKGPAFTNWMADRIDEIAGNVGRDGKPDRPLTVGQLQAHGVSVAAMTTDLSTGRPYQLPLRTHIHYFSKREFEELFPSRVVDYLVREKDRLETTRADLPNDLYKLPVDGDMPVLLVARMSLSFPGLIRAVPLYRFDDEIKQENREERLRKCLFSDGGISSNFPIHFFDEFLPSRPTLGITLAEHSEERHKQLRVWLPSKARTRTTALPVRAIDSVLGFLMSIVDTAKDWQDTLQTKLPGYAERIVEIRLAKNEGGMNLKMPPDTIERLAGYGRDAGRRLVEDFDFNEHRWRRALSFMSKLEEELASLADSYGKPAAGGKHSDYSLRDVLLDYPAKSYDNPLQWRLNVLAAFVEKLSALGEDATRAMLDPSRKCVREGNVPHIDARIRLIADADRVPAGAAGAGEAD